MKPANDRVQGAGAKPVSDWCPHAFAINESVSRNA